MARLLFPLWCRVAIFFAGAIFLLAPVPLSAANTPKDPGSKPAFVERIPPADFLAVEELSQHRFTAASEVVILKTEHGQVGYALTLRQDATAGYVWDAYFITPGVEPKEPTVSIEFGPKITSEYMTALNYRMSRWVTVVEKSHKPSSYDGAWWIYYRVKNGAIAGLLDTADIASLPDAKQFADLFIEAPRRLLVSDTAQQVAILDEIESKCRDVIRVELAK
jgi:hypothetical protein